MLAWSLMVVAIAWGSPAQMIEGVGRARHDLAISFETGGRIDDVLVEAGDRVEDGELLMRLDDREIRVQLELLEIRAESDLEAAAAKAEWEMAVTDQSRVEEALAKGAAADFEVERAELSAMRAKLRYELFLQRQEEAKRQLEQVRAQHERFFLRAPMAGIIEDVAFDRGEGVEALSPVIRLVVIDPLLVEVAVPTIQSLDLRVGQGVSLYIDLPGVREAPIEGTIIHVAAVADAASATRLVRIEAPNPQELPAGADVKALFDGGEEARRAQERRATENGLPESGKPSVAHFPLVCE